MLCCWEGNRRPGESNGSLPRGGWLIVTCGLTACTPGSAPAQTLGNEYGKPLFFTYSSEVAVIWVAIDMYITTCTTITTITTTTTTAAAAAAANYCDKSEIIPNANEKQVE